MTSTDTPRGLDQGGQEMLAASRTSAIEMLRERGAVLRMSEAEARE